MKLGAAFFGSMLIVLFSATISGALELDAPHNKANGIYCYHCHSADPSDSSDLWFNPPDPGGADPLDLTTFNWVCNRCHADVAEQAIESLDPAFGDGTQLVGPKKKLHSSAVTGLNCIAISIVGIRNEISAGGIADTTG